MSALSYGSKHWAMVKINHKYKERNYILLDKNNLTHLIKYQNTSVRDKY
jgi:hypothetical protein